MKQLRRMLFGNPILRQKSPPLSDKEILSAEIQDLIKNMYHTLRTRKYGVGLAAPQVGKSAALSVIGLKPSPTRPNVKEVNMVIINPAVVKTYGRRTQLWEACLSLGSGAATPYAKVPRYKKVRVRYQDKEAKSHEADFDGLLAHVMQHEIDHLNGILFVDHVKDMKTFITGSELRKRYLKNLKPNE
jgi:peptide deformylase